MRYFIVPLAATLLATVHASATEPADLARSALDVLRANCYRCHACIVGIWYM